jgi:hypothetical protein
MLYLSEREVTYLIALVGTMSREEILNSGMNDAVIATGLKVKSSIRTERGKFITPPWELVY